MREDIALLFQFDDAADASLASGTLEELGYEPVVREGMEVHIHLAGGDLTSALEIAQTHGGRLAMQTPIGGAEPQLAMQISDPDDIPIPAHMVNEDWIGSEENGFDPSAGSGQ